MKIIEIRVKLEEGVTEAGANDMGEEIKDLIHDWDDETGDITDVTYEYRDDVQE